MPMFMIIALDIIITLHFPINCSAVICSPTVIFSIMREASSETYGPRVYFPSYNLLFSIIQVSDLLFCNLLLSNLQTKNTKNIYFTVYLSLRDLTFASNREGIDNPFIALGASWCLFVQVFGGLRVVSYWIDTLVLKTEGNTYSTLLHHPFLFKGKTNASSRSSRKNFWRRCRGDLRQAETYQVPIINSHPSHYTIHHSPLVFLSPTSKTIFEKICLFFVSLPFIFLPLWPNLEGLRVFS